MVWPAEDPGQFVYRRRSTIKRAREMPATDKSGQTAGNIGQNRLAGPADWPSRKQRPLSTAGPKIHLAPTTPVALSSNIATSWGKPRREWLGHWLGKAGEVACGAQLGVI